MRERSVVTEQREEVEAEDGGMLACFFSKLHKRRGWRSEGCEPEELLLLDCSSIWIFVVLPEERLQSCIPGAAVGVRNQMGSIEVQQTLTGFSFPWV